MDLKLFLALFIAVSIGSYYTNKTKKETIQKKKLEDIKQNIKLNETEKIAKVKKKSKEADNKKE